MMKMAKKIFMSPVKINKSFMTANYNTFNSHLPNDGPGPAYIVPRRTQLDSW